MAMNRLVINRRHCIDMRIDRIIRIRIMGDAVILIDAIGIVDDTVAEIVGIAIAGTVIGGATIVGTAIAEIVTGTITDVVGMIVDSVFVQSSKSLGLYCSAVLTVCM